MTITAPFVLKFHFKPFVGLLTNAIEYSPSSDTASKLNIAKVHKMFKDNGLHTDIHVENNTVRLNASFDSHVSLMLNLEALKLLTGRPGNFDNIAEEMNPNPLLRKSDGKYVITSKALSLKEKMRLEIPYPLMTQRIAFASSELLRTSVYASGNNTDLDICTVKHVRISVMVDANAVKAECARAQFSASLVA